MSGKSEYPEIWFRGLNEKDREASLQTLRYSSVIKRLVEITEGFLREVEEPSRKDYDNPSWAYKQAHFNGEIIAYKKLLEILRPKGTK